MLNRLDILKIFSAAAAFREAAARSACRRRS